MTTATETVIKITEYKGFLVYKYLDCDRGLSPYNAISLYTKHVARRNTLDDTIAAIDEWWNVEEAK